MPSYLEIDFMPKGVIPAPSYTTPGLVDSGLRPLGPNDLGRWGGGEDDFRGG